MRAFVEKLGQSFFLRATNVYRLAINDLRHVRRLVVHVADQNCLGRANDDARRLEADVDAMRAEVTFFSRMIFGVDENGVIRAGGHAGFAADADRFVEVDYAVRALEHRRCRTRSHARRVRALVAAGHLMRAAHLRKDAYVDVLDIGPRHANRHDVFRLAGRRARMTADAAGVIDYLGPLHALVASCLFVWHLSFFETKLRSAKYITQMREGRKGMCQRVMVYFE